MDDFLKRRASLYKHASELIGDFDVDMGIIIFSPAGKPYAFFHPTDDVVVNRFLNPDMKLSENSTLVAEKTQKTVNYLEFRLHEYDMIEAAARDRKLALDKISVKKNWFDSIESFDAEKMAKFDVILETIIFNLEIRLEQLEKGASSSARDPPGDAN
ncbi:agamous-like MADS-box protein AGL29 [Lycium barbarum]|uniref:agamous-like MADS-box protein AGL29 n=1 Tax=Lycium barbarum TaxID=112863 RepID=UPI00293EA8D3|nr:agamous-like MADS-box protein AGL29 [Lycium barbarum]